MNQRGRWTRCIAMVIPCLCMISSFANAGDNKNLTFEFKVEVRPNSQKAEWKRIASYKKKGDADSLAKKIESLNLLNARVIQK